MVKQRRRLKPDLSGRKLRSAISNGKHILDSSVDHRTAWMRRLRDLIADHTSDLGGADVMSTSEQTLVRRAAMLTLQCEMMESKWAAEREGEAGAPQLKLYQMTSNTLRRTLESLGLTRRAKDITPVHPLRYAKEFEAKRSAEHAEDLDLGRARARRRIGDRAVGEGAEVLVAAADDVGRELERPG